MSNDAPVGRVFNVPQYALLTHLLAQCAGMVAEKLVVVNGDLHIYHDQVDGVLEQLGRDSHPDSHPVVRLNPEIKQIDDFTFDDIAIEGYESQGPIKFPVAV